MIQTIIVLIIVAFAAVMLVRKLRAKGKGKCDDCCSCPVKGDCSKSKD